MFPPTHSNNNNATTKKASNAGDGCWWRGKCSQDKDGKEIRGRRTRASGIAEDREPLFYYFPFYGRIYICIYRPSVPPFWPSSILWKPNQRRRGEAGKGASAGTTISSLASIVLFVMAVLVGLWVEYEDQNCEIYFK